MPSHITPLPHADDEHATSQISGLFRYAGFWFRTLASIIDSVLIQVAAFLLILPLGFMLGASMAGTASLREVETAGEALGYVVSISFNWLYFTIFESSKWQATLGKKMLGIKVVDENGRRIGFGTANCQAQDNATSVNVRATHAALSRDE